MNTENQAQARAAKEGLFVSNLASQTRVGDFFWQCTDSDPDGGMFRFISAPERDLRLTQQKGFMNGRGEKRACTMWRLETLNGDKVVKVVATASITVVSRGMGRMAEHNVYRGPWAEFRQLIAACNPALLAYQKQRHLALLEAFGLKG